MISSNYSIRIFSSMYIVTVDMTALITLPHLTLHTLSYFILFHFIFTYLYRALTAALFQMTISHSHEDWSILSSMLQHQSAYVYDTYYLMLPHFTRHITPHHVISCHKYVINIETRLLLSRRQSLLSSSLSCRGVRRPCCLLIYKWDGDGRDTFNF